MNSLLKSVKFLDSVNLVFHAFVITNTMQGEDTYVFSPFFLEFSLNFQSDVLLYGISFHRKLE